jgi:hypothetical protein
MVACAWRGDLKWGNDEVSRSGLGDADDRVWQRWHAALFTHRCPRSQVKMSVQTDHHKLTAHKSKCPCRQTTTSSPLTSQNVRADRPPQAHPLTSQNVRADRPPQAHPLTSQNVRADRPPQAHRSQVKMSVQTDHHKLTVLYRVDPLVRFRSTFASSAWLCWAALC